MQQHRLKVPSRDELPPVLAAIRPMLRYVVGALQLSESDNLFQSPHLQAASSASLSDTQVLNTFFRRLGARIEQCVASSAAQQPLPSSPLASSGASTVPESIDTIPAASKRRTRRKRRPRSSKATSEKQSTAGVAAEQCSLPFTADSSTHQSATSTKQPAQPSILRSDSGPADYDDELYCSCWDTAVLEADPLQPAGPSQEQFMARDIIEECSSSSAAGLASLSTASAIISYSMPVFEPGTDSATPVDSGEACSPSTTAAVWKYYFDPEDNQPLPVSAVDRLDWTYVAKLLVRDHIPQATREYVYSCIASRAAESDY